MDTVTQMVLGAAVGQAVAGRKLGARAMAWGAVAGLVPDLDVFRPETHPLGMWIHHRGITHSLWFGPVVGTVAGLVGWRIARLRAPDASRAAPDAWRPWVALWVLGLLTHPLLDLFTIWGTQLLAPFSRTRFALSGVPIIDPVYTLTLLAALVVASRFGTRTRGAQAAAVVGLALTTAYLFVGLAQNGRAERLAAADLAAKGVATTEITGWTTMFTPWLRRVVAETEDGHLVGFVSTLAPRDIAWTAVPITAEARAVAARALATEDGDIFRAFAVGPIHASVDAAAEGPILRLHDMRYGFPGDSIAGLWGAQWRVESQSPLAPAGPAQRWSNRPVVSAESVLDIFRASFGLASRSF